MPINVRLTRHECGCTRLRPACCWIMPASGFSQLRRSFRSLLPQEVHEDSPSSVAARTAHKINNGTGHRSLGCMDGMDPGWHGLLHLRAGAEPGTDGTAAKIRDSEYTRKCWPGRLHSFCLVSGRV